MLALKGNQGTLNDDVRFFLESEFKKDSSSSIEETCDIKGKTSAERRFFISNLPPNARKIAQAVRAHWMVENNLQREPLKVWG